MKIIIFIFLLLTAQKSFAAKEYKPESKASNALYEVEKYLNKTQYFYADFIQKSAEGNSFGNIYISRPGKLKMTYVNPNELDIIINEEIFLYHDKNLDERSYLNSDNFPISFLTRNDISFFNKDDQILLENISNKDGAIIISMAFILEQGVQRSFKLGFDLKPIKLKFIEVFDANNKPIHIKLISPKYNKKIDNKIFLTTK